MVRLPRAIYWLISPELDDAFNQWLVVHGGEIWTTHIGPWFRFKRLTDTHSARIVQEISSHAEIDVLIFAHDRHLQVLANPTKHTAVQVETAINGSERVPFSRFFQILIADDD